ncbi:hypothetical protein D3C75_787510 [compost metagenome]
MNQHIVGIPPGQCVHLEQSAFTAAGLRQLEAIHHSGKELAVSNNLCVKRCRAKQTLPAIQQPLQGQGPVFAVFQLHNHKRCTALSGTIHQDGLIPQPVSRAVQMHPVGQFRVYLRTCP